MKPSKLSEHLKKETISGTKLELNFREIAYLDCVNLKLVSITHLDLSFNLLTELNGIEQFPSLTYFNISNNHLKSLLSLSNIVKKDILTVLMIKGNPAARHPNLVPIILNYFPNIREVDGDVINYSTQKDIMQAMELSSSLIPYLYINEQFILKVHREIMFFQLKAELFQAVWPTLPRSQLPVTSEIRQLNVKHSQKYKEIIQTAAEAKVRPTHVLDYMQKVQDQLHINSAHLEEETVCKIYKWLYCEILLYLHNQGSVDLQCFLQTYEEDSNDLSDPTKVDGVMSDLLKFSQLSHYPQSLLHFPVFGCNAEYMKALLSVLSKQVAVINSLIKERKGLLLAEGCDSCDEVLSPPSKASYPSLQPHEYCSPSTLQSLAYPLGKSPSNSGNLEINNFLSPKFRQDSAKSEKKTEIKFFDQEVVSKLEFEEESDMDITNSFEELSQTIEDLLRDDDRNQEKAKGFWRRGRMKKAFDEMKDDWRIGKCVRNREIKSNWKVFCCWKTFVLRRKAKESKIWIIKRKSEMRVARKVIWYWNEFTRQTGEKRNSLAIYHREQSRKLKLFRLLQQVVKIKHMNKEYAKLHHIRHLKSLGFMTLKHYIRRVVHRKNIVRQHKIKSMKSVLKKILRNWLYLVRPSAKFLKSTSQKSSSQVDKLLQKLQQKDKEIVSLFKRYKKGIKP
jgi:hypothetical protein